jgi:hypothetical protein
MKHLISLTLVLFMGVMLHAQDAKVAKIEFKTDVIDYGEIAKGSNGVRFFEFTNTGNAPLVISQVTSSCGCTVPSWTKEAVAPGKSGQIEVKYDTNKPGPIRKTITVMSNAETPNVALKIKGTVIEEGSAGK